MRPGQLRPGNIIGQDQLTSAEALASMRPGQLRPGNKADDWAAMQGMAELQ